MTRTGAEEKMSPRTRTAFLGRGWRFPPTFGACGGDVETVAGEANVQQSLEILLTTAPGERVLQEAFGCDLRRVMFEEADEGLAGAVRRLIEDAVAAHEPRIELDRVDVERTEDEAYGLLVHIHYTVLGKRSRFNLVFPFHHMEPALPGL